MKEPLKISDIHHVLILGAGTLGLRVGLQAALSGYKVCIYDIDSKQLEIAKKVQEKLLNSFSLPSNSMKNIIDSIQFSTDAELAAKDADIVNESVIEDIKVKKEVWKQFGALCPPHTIFTTNTSFLLPSMFSAASGRAERFCAFHFHDVFVANVVDIMPHTDTADWVIDLLYEFGLKLKQTPVIVQKESSGYLFNFMLLNSLQAAVLLLDKGIGSIQDIDRSWMGNFNMPVGPFGMLDQIGLDTAWRIANNQNTNEGDRFASVLKKYTDLNHLGVKSGKGFYDYPNPEYQEKDFLNSSS